MVSVLVRRVSSGTSRSTAIVVGSIANRETVEVAVAPGHHTLRLGSGRRRSAERSFDVAQDEVAAFSCHGPRFWPQLLAALVKQRSLDHAAPGVSRSRAVTDTDDGPL